MWWDILPSFAIITACMAAPHYIAYGANWLITWWNFNEGNPYRRSMLDKYETLQYFRDMRLGHVYKMQGLENLPDDEDEKKENEEKEEKEENNATTDTNEETKK